MSDIPEELPTSPDTPAALAATVRMAVRPLTPGMRGFDTVATLTAENGRAFRQGGYEFVCRYLDSLTLGEIAGILSAGLGLMGVRYARADGWAPTGAEGAADGASTVNKARALGMPKGWGIACDLEGCAIGTSQADVTAYLDAWGAAVTGAGYVAVLYVGTKCVLTGVQLGALRYFTHYWRSCSWVPEVSVGYCMLQSRGAENVVIFGVKVDVDQVEHDLHSPPRTPPAVFQAAA
ncbi:MAG TPA: glycoside hydrolase domain-containing protein [Polyangiaceae bacterium]|nr:glycoside hydrolase domain-containing protein [Polyangiaceae bacterium]